MNKPNISKFFKDTKALAIKYSPEILTGIGIAGMITTTVLAVKATPKALQLMEDEKAELDLHPDDSLTVAETIKVAWKPYIPAAITGTVSVACLIGASSVNLKRNAALATAYKLSETALAEYKEKVVETIGERKEKTIREKVAQDKVKNAKPVNKEVIITGSGETLFLDSISMRTFKSDIEVIRKIVNNLNYRMVSGMEEYIALNEFYDEIGLPRTKVGDDLGWNLGRDGQIDIDYEPQLYEDKPCILLDYRVAPRYDYSRLM